MNAYIPVLILLSVLLSVVSGYFITVALCELLANRQIMRFVRQRLVDYSGIGQPDRLHLRLFRALEDMVAQTWIGKKIDALIDDADLEIGVLTVVGGWLAICAFFYLVFLLFLQFNIFPNLILSGLFGTGMVFYYLLSRKDAYARALQAQTPEIAQLMSNSLRAGQSLYYSLQEIEEKLPRPANREFRKLRLQVDIGGLSIDQALRNLLKRFPSEEMRILVTSLLVQRKAGGDLINALESIGKAINARRRVRNEIDTVTAEARQTTLIVMALPIVVLILLNQLSPGMVSDFINESSWGLPFTIVVYALPQVLAVYLIRRIGDVKV